MDTATNDRKMVLSNWKVIVPSWNLWNAEMRKSKHHICTEIPHITQLYTTYRQIQLDVDTIVCIKRCMMPFDSSQTFFLCTPELQFKAEHSSLTSLIGSYSLEKNSEIWNVVISLDWLVHQWGWNLDAVVLWDNTNGSALLPAVFKFCLL